jgi:transcriptional regulator with XRE-family HTH domain
MTADNLHVALDLPPPTVFWRVEGAELGAVIRARRKERGQTIDDLAGDAGMHPTYLSGIERGVRNPTWDKVSDLAEALEVPVSVLAREAEDHRIEQAIRAAAADAYRAACTQHAMTRAGPPHGRAQG